MQSSSLHTEDSIFIRMRTLMGIDPSGSIHGGNLLMEAPSKPGNEAKKKQTEAKARGHYRQYTPQQIERLFDLAIEEGRSVKEVVLITGINGRTAQNYVKAHRDDEQKHLSRIKRKPHKGYPGKLSEVHTRFLTQFVNQTPAAVLLDIKKSLCKAFEDLEISEPALHRHTWWTSAA
ncbi:hypothetical protein BX070DRAFT_233326 [Coemansia spiralis]|nr:hypothetical protein BX070DRAFT_233326 [Coemansia spiralis]